MHHSGGDHPSVGHHLDHGFHRGIRKLKKYGNCRREMLLSPALRRITWTAGIRPNKLERKGALMQLSVIHKAISDHDEAEAYREMQILEEGYLETMRTQYSEEIRKVVSWTDSVP